LIPDEFIEMSKAYRVLSDLEPAKLKTLLPLAHDTNFKTGDIIFREGDRSRNLHLIVSGEVALETAATQVQTLRPGEAMGWSALTPGSRTHFQARALTPVTTVAFPGDLLRAACDRDPQVGYALTSNLLELVTERLDAMRMQLAT
jgi:CRP/FNR family transcriptional regulator, cyclic AMP receptor protein